MSASRLFAMRYDEPNIFSFSIFIYRKQVTMHCWHRFFALLVFLGLPALGLAQAAGSGGAQSTQAQINALNTAVANAQSAGDNAWMLTSAALVLLMTGPGLALFYGGLVRKKNILGTMMQSFAMMGLVTILWALIGYSLAFGHGNWFVGGFEHVFLNNVPLTPSLEKVY